MHTFFGAAKIQTTVAAAGEALRRGKRGLGPYGQLGQWSLCGVCPSSSTPMNGMKGRSNEMNGNEWTEEMLPDLSTNLHIIGDITKDLFYFERKYL